MFDDSHDRGFQVGPTEPLPLRFRLTTDDKVPAGSVLLETLLKGRTIARGVVDAEGGAALAERGEVTAPLLLHAEEHEGEIRGQILALFPLPKDQARDMMGASGEEEAWKQSVPTYDPEGGDADVGEAVPMAGVLLGSVKRFAEDRQHPDDPRAEAASLFRAILTGAGRDADKKAIDRLLDSL